MTDPVEIQSLNARVDEAIAGVRELRRSVEGMTHATVELSAIQREQANLRAKAEAAEALAKKTQAVNDARAKRTRKGLRQLTVALILVLAALAIAVGTVAVVVANDAADRARELIDDANRNRYPSCIQRNASSEVQIQRERVLAAIPGLDPIEAQAHADSATALEHLLVDCEQYRQTP
ncbi:hypothetical protein KIH74_23000 [Kineosporia sp. J2-2]|uniref:Uncharacterized protein n=1 Tax=Kineosporia corallincola TaxID=2835133 RepID=A0ABS5TL38_9ACTN|nr:hypothetical protein [Kineosporia corallincola]MBT0771828.1 hypothetical protein [Kineosporia corallincola]